MADEKRTAAPAFPDAATFSKDPPLVTRLTQYRRRLARRNDAAQNSAWISDSIAALEGAMETLRKEGFKPGSTEAAWMAVHQVRQALCLRDDRAALIEIAHEIHTDLLDCAIVQRACRDDVQGLIDEFITGDGPPTALARNRLYSLAIIAAAQRESDWRRANHVVLRRFRASIAVIVVTAILLITLPFGFAHIAVGEGFWPLVYSWAREAGCILAVLACGALGGLMSVLLRQERILLNSVEHHVIIATTKLRPVVGAASALVFFIVWESGLLQMADSGHRRPGVVSGTLLLIAVVAGFSERLLLGQIEKISAVLDGAHQQAASSEPSEPKPQEAPAKETTLANKDRPDDAVNSAPVPEA